MKAKIEAGNQDIDPARAGWMLKNCSLPCQEPRTKSGRLHILRHVENARRGHWLPYSQISFATVGSVFYLVNGYHRLHAVIEHDRALSFNVVIHPCEDMDDVLSLYAKYDRAPLQRGRSEEQALNSINFAEKMGITRTAARSIYRAMPLIRNGMKAIRASHEETRLEMAILESRTDIAYSWKAEAQLWDKVVDEARGELKRRLLNPSLVAVALHTIKYQRDLAIEFWSLVSRNDGLSAGTPEHSLVTTLLARRGIPGAEENFYVPAIAWNAYFRNKPLQIIRASAMRQLLIAGTPVGAGKKNVNRD